MKFLILATLILSTSSAFASRNATRMEKDSMCDALNRASEQGRLGSRYIDYGSCVRRNMTVSNSRNLAAKVISVEFNHRIRGAFTCNALLDIETNRVIESTVRCQ